MIASLAGVVQQIGADSAVIDVNGVGYLVFASVRTLSALPPRGAPVRLLIETHVREDHIHLYGFGDEAERDWFRLLTTVQGVGAKTGLAILAVLAPEALTMAVLSQDKVALTRADGVGPKLAQRIVNELKDKVGNIALGPFARSGEGKGDAATVPSGLAADAVSALVNLGYARSDAFSAVNEAQRALGAAAQFDALVRASLKELAR